MSERFKIGFYIAKSLIRTTRCLISEDGRYLHEHKTSMFSNSNHSRDTQKRVQERNEPRPLDLWLSPEEGKAFKQQRMKSRGDKKMRVLLSITLFCVVFGFAGTTENEWQTAKKEGIADQDSNKVIEIMLKWRPSPGMDYIYLPSNLYYEQVNGVIELEQLFYSSIDLDIFGLSSPFNVAWYAIDAETQLSSLTGSVIDTCFTTSDESGFSLTINHPGGANKELQESITWVLIPRKNKMAADDHVPYLLKNTLKYNLNPIQVDHEGESWFAFMSKPVLKDVKIPILSNEEAGYIGICYMYNSDILPSLEKFIFFGLENDYWIGVKYRLYSQQITEKFIDKWYNLISSRISTLVFNYRMFLIYRTQQN